MIKQSIKYIAKFLAISLHNIFLAILIAIIGLPVLVSWVTGTLNILIQTIKSPSPLWGTIALALLFCLYILIKSKQNSPSHELPIKIELIEVDRFKWKTEVYQNGEFKIHHIPYCIIHDTRLIKHFHGDTAIYACPAEQGCKSTIKEIRLAVQQDKA